MKFSKALHNMIEHNQIKSEDADWILKDMEKEEIGYFSWGLLLGIVIGVSITLLFK